ncbi:MFS transporter [Confluentibacter lentus]|uniref:MFS transporter n=1 Tax=Confluentibacter lentus TaxID=1699412 RepID=UPI000C286CD6|nr:MFS transporter [Confluentibacter lentus]
MKKKTKTKLNEQNQWLYGRQRTSLLITLLLVSIVSQIDRVLPFILAESIKTDLKLSDTQIGLITGLAFTVCYALAALPLARISDKGWARKVLLWSVIFWSIMTGLGGLAVGFVTLTFSRIGVALGEAGGTPASHAIIAQRIPENFRGRAIAIFSMGIPLGTMLGFAVGGWASDSIGWRNALFGAGVLGLIVVIFVLSFIRKQEVFKQKAKTEENFIKASRELFSKPAFKWLFMAAILMGLSSAPFYIFTSPFLIRTFGLTAGEVGLSFGLLQGIMGIVGTLFGGRMFDRIAGNGYKGLMNPPATIFIIASITTSIALFMPNSWMSILLLIPGMFSFAFMMPFAFGAGHLVAGPKKQAFSISLLMLGSGLIGATISPFLVGAISDFASASHVDSGLQMGLLLVPLFSFQLGIVGFIVSRKISSFLKNNN